MDRPGAIAKERTHQAFARGDFEPLPGPGQPPVLNNNAMAPASLRMA